MSDLELKATRKEFTLGDESGYEFHIVAVHDPEFGWDASVMIVARGHRTDGYAIQALRPAIVRLLEMLPQSEEP